MTMSPASELLSWYDQHARTLPWRAVAGQTPDPYHVWLSEIMLQQTTVTTVKPYFEKFLRLFPTVQKLAAAPEPSVMAAWAGLGYYSRARNLHACARHISTRLDGKFPETEADLQLLPGIGPYTAAAIAAIAFNQPAAPVDGNIERVLSRISADTTPLPALKKPIKAFNQTLVPAQRPGDFAQAMMDLGASICTPKRPNCPACPWQDRCQAHQQGIAESLPRRAPKKPKPERAGTVFWLENNAHEVLMARRPNKGLLGGMLMFPSRGWDPQNDTQLPDLLPANWSKLSDEVVHVFTHFRLTLKVEAQTAPLGFREPDGYQWVNPRDFADEALPSVMRKIANLVLA